MTWNIQHERLLQIDEQIRKHKFPSRISLALEHEVSKRTIQRDLDFLRDRLSAPLAYDKTKKGYYYTESSWFLPAVPMSEGDLFALMVARQAMSQYAGTPVAQTLERIFQKICGNLAETISFQTHYTSTALSFAPPPALPVQEETWNTLLHGTRTKTQVNITYYSRRSNKTSQRTINPYHIINIQGDWYVFAYCHQRRKVLQFLIHRIGQAEKTDTAFEVPPGFDPQQYIQNSFGSFASNAQLHTVKIHITGDMAELLTGRTLHPKQKVTHHKDRSITITFPASAEGKRPYFNLIQWILSLGPDATVLAPKQLKHLVQTEIDTMQKIYKKISE